MMNAAVPSPTMGAFSTSQLIFHAAVEENTQLLITAAAPQTSSLNMYILPP